MISLRQFIEGAEEPAAASLDGATAQLHRLLTDGIEARNSWGPDALSSEFRLAGRHLLLRLEEAADPLGLVVAASETLALLEAHSASTVQHLREQAGDMRSIVLMLTETIAQISAQSDTSIAQLRVVERQLEQAYVLDDIRALKAGLARCLTDVKEATALQRSAAAATVDRLQEQVRKIPQPWKPEPKDSTVDPGGDRTRADAAEVEYVAAFKLQRAGYIQYRFGADTTEQMLGMVADALQAVQGPNDRLMRWKGSSFVMLGTTGEQLTTVRQRLSVIVGRLGQRYVEVGKNAALLAVGIDWVLFPQAQYPSVEAVFEEIDSFLGETSTHKWK